MIKFERRYGITKFNRSDWSNLVDGVKDVFKAELTPATDYIDAETLHEITLYLQNYIEVINTFTERDEDKLPLPDTWSGGRIPEYIEMRWDNLNTVYGLLETAIYNQGNRWEYWRVLSDLGFTVMRGSTYYTDHIPGFKPEAGDKITFYKDGEEYLIITAKASETAPGGMVWVWTKQGTHDFYYIPSSFFGYELMEGTGEEEEDPAMIKEILEGTGYIKTPPYITKIAKNKFRGNLISGFENTSDEIILEDYAFSQAQNLVDIKLKGKVTFCHSVFKSCINLNNLVFGPEITEFIAKYNYDTPPFGSCNIQKATFLERKDGTSLAVPLRFLNATKTRFIVDFQDGSVSSIGNRAFYWALKNETLVLPASLKKIDNTAFGENPSLKKVYFKGKPDSIPTYENPIFESSLNITDIYMPWGEGEFDLRAFVPKSKVDGITWHYNYTGPYPENA